MLPLRRLLNLVYHFALQGATADARAEVDTQLAAAGALVVDRPPERQPDRATAQARHVPGTAPAWIRPPSWWKGDRAAFNTSVAAAEQLGEPAAKAFGRRTPPTVGRRG